MPNQAVAQKITVSVSLQTEQGPVSASYGTEVQTVSFTKVSVPKNEGGTDGEKKAPVRPADTTLHFVLVKVNPPEAGKNLKVKTTEDPVDLDAPLILLGAPATELFTAEPTEFSFQNSGDEDVEVTLVAGWMAKT